MKDNIDGWERPNYVTVKDWDEMISKIKSGEMKLHLGYPEGWRTKPDEVTGLYMTDWKALEDMDTTDIA